MTKHQDANAAYWDEYTNLQHIKHTVIARYLGAWFAILSHGGYKELWYIETHAGRGRHSSGQVGSPIVAMNTLLCHSAMSAILNSAKVRFRFLEIDSENAACLRAEVAAIGELPPAIDCRVYEQDYGDFLDKVIESSAKPQFRMGPAFVFVDPFGYSLPLDKIATLLRNLKCEIFINFMWRFVDMAIHDPGKSTSLTAMFGSDAWLALRDILDPTERCDKAIELLRKCLGATHYWTLKMLAENGSVKYVLLHAANHERAFDAMKSSMWAISPEGNFRVSQSDDPNQEILLTASPNFKPLEDKIWSQYLGKSVATGVIDDFVNKTVYLQKHGRDLLRNWVAQGNCELLPPAKKIVFSQAPTIRFVRRP